VHLQVCKLVADIAMAATSGKALVQTVLTSRGWSEDLIQIIRSFTPPGLIVQSGLELLAYCQVAPRLHAVTPASRNAIVLELLRGTISKSVVCCSSAEEAEHLWSFLKSFGVTNVLLASKQDATAINGNVSIIFGI
jgi:superfamily II DNA/RNA helicase